MGGTRRAKERKRASSTATSAPLTGVLLATEVAVPEHAIPRKATPGVDVTPAFCASGRATSPLETRDGDRVLVRPMPGKRLDDDAEGDVGGGREILRGGDVVRRQADVCWR